MTNAGNAPEGENCSLLIFEDTLELPKQDELRKQLESKDENVKIQALKSIILHTLNGEKLPKLLMTVIKYALHTEDHMIKKLLLLYWETVDKKGRDGKLLPEMILVCNAMKNNLVHANEFIRGATLRFLCHIKEPEILESLIPSITANLEHRHSYVRKNATLTIYTVFQACPELIPDAPELIEKFIYQEANPAAKRNAFIMLLKCDLERAVKYLATVIDQLGNMGEQFQLVALELIRTVCRANPLVKSQYVRCIFNLTNSTSNAVAYEAANTLVHLSSAPTAVRAAVSAYTRLLVAESDNNVKLIILDRLAGLKKRHEKILQDMLMDMLRVLTTPNIDIRKKVLELSLDLVCPRNVEEVVQLLKKELVKLEQDKSSAKYRKLLVETLHACAANFPDVVSQVVQALIGYISDEDAASAMDVITFVREIVELYPELRPGVLTSLTESFDEIRSVDVYRTAMWVLGEYAQEPEIVQRSLDTIYESIGPLPFTVPRTAEELVAEAESKAGESNETSGSSRPVVLADGTYAQQSSLSEPVKVDDAPSDPLASLRSLIESGNYFIAATVANTITKLLLRFCTLHGYGVPQSNVAVAKGMLMLTSIVRFGSSGRVKNKIDKDSHQRVMLCLRTLIDPRAMSEIFLSQCRTAFVSMLQQQKRDTAVVVEDEKQVHRHVDDVISIRQLKGPSVLTDLEDDDGLEKSGAGAISKLAAPRVFQLTGFGDPVYAEAYLSVMEYDIVLDLLVVNQTNSVLQNLTVELSTSKDLKLVERPQTFNVAANDFVKIKHHIKVRATETGMIFGNIVYGSTDGQNQTIVVLNSIHMDIIDYIRPATCTAPQFRSMWAEFEWENKVAVNTDIGSTREYLDHIVKITNMKCQTPPESLQGSCNYLAANLYARSIFAEDALLNLSIEILPSGKITGYIRIRSKHQGIALSLGEKITNGQRGPGR